MCGVGSEGHVGENVSKGVWGKDLHKKNVIERGQGDCNEANEWGGHVLIVMVIIGVGDSKMSVCRG